MKKYRALAVVLGACALVVTGCGSSSRAKAVKTDTALVGVNAFLWRASLDTIDFMPLASADPQSGIIITDWYTNPKVPDERFKMTIYILDTRLRADGLNVSVFKQTRTGSEWSDAATDPDTEVQLENAILTRARELKVGDFS
jgi:hypothetical protein